MRPFDPSQESEQPPEWRTRHTVLLVVILLFVFSWLVTLCEEDESGDVAEPAPTTAESTTTTTQRPQASTASSTATTTTTAPTTTTAVATKVIPGLDPVDVTLNVEKLGFDCGGAEKGQLYWTYSCDRDIDNVTVYTDSARRVLQVESSVIGPEAQGVLEYVATVPYRGAQQEAARDWVTANFPRVRQGAPIESTFGGVRFSLYGNPGGEAYFLEIGELS